MKLRELRGGRYVTITTKKSTRVGGFTFKNVVLDGPTSLRVRAPRHKVNPGSRGLKSIVTKPVNVDVRGAVLPADGAPADRPARADARRPRRHRPGRG
ncbi:hypothetical protein [Nocardioides sp. B-3]|uniref:hypothetical protein n=1 Tax=Nocardioides sp. B-3 TaxID=2895565 RepID=UPI00215351D4|nr:hypothetical protein [Nocardioides sp. B-3]UUZ60972.1 hypothetical protein LP418_09930 [Nocardioides sp. B-3]